MNRENEQNILVFNANNEFELTVRLEQETVWLTQKQMAELFGVQRPAITKHLKNIFLSDELNENMVCSILELTTNHGAMTDKTQTNKVKYYNLDAIIAVGYRVNSKQATHFRIWATNVLREYLLQGYSINEKRLKENKQQFLTALHNLKIVTKDKPLIKSDDVLALVENFADTWLTLDRFDKAEFPENTVQNNQQNIDCDTDDLYRDLQIFKQELIQKNEATVLFAQEKNIGTLSGILGSIFQSVFGQDAYPSIEEKAAHLLYFIVKNHPFNDGNKRSGAFAFVWFLTKFNFDFSNKINPQALTALTLVIAESNPNDKDKMIGLIKLLLQ